MNGSPWQGEKRGTRASACKKAKGQKRLSEAERKRESEAEQFSRQGSPPARLHHSERAEPAGHHKRQEKEGTARRRVSRNILELSTTAKTDQRTGTATPCPNLAPSSRRQASRTAPSALTQEQKEMQKQEKKKVAHVKTKIPRVQDFILFSDLLGS